MARRGDHIHKRKDGRWEGRYKDGCRADGTAKYSSVYARSYVECKKKLSNAQYAASGTTGRTRTEKLFSELLFQWLAANQIRLKGASAAKYTNIIESHIVPSLGGIKLSALNAGSINAFLDKQLNQGRIDAGTSLAPSYVRSMAIIIEAAINYGVREGWCDPLRTPINKPAIPKKELAVLSRKAEAALTEVLTRDLSKAAVGMLLALQAGLRIGEVCALRWCDVDFERHIIHVRHTISRVLSPNGAHKTVQILDTPKTPSSLRDIPFPSSLGKVLLHTYRNRVSEYVVSERPSFVGTRTFDYQYRRLLKKYRIQVFSFHTLRHTYATRCAEYGMDAKMLSRLLGHSSANTSLNIYVHPSLDVAMQWLEQIYCAA